jgi:mannitol/fructose-specific phosphotransferase system IIA component (Ntr-type)
MTKPHDSQFNFPVVDLPPSASSSPGAVIHFLIGKLVESGEIRPEHASRVACQILHREALGSTGIGHGVAIPHYKSDAVDRVVGLVGRSLSGVHWPGGFDAQPVHVVCLLVTPVSDPARSLGALKTLVAQLRDNAE